MSTITNYCTRAQLESRLGDTGVLYVADDNQDGIASEAELVAALDAAIVSAGAEIDAALDQHLATVPLSQDDGSLNRWLRDRCLTLSTCYCYWRRSADLSDALQAELEQAREWLDMVRKGTLRVPGLAYPIDSFETERRQVGRPCVARLIK